ncbi:Tigger transposable element-derived protein 2 [Mycena venus]|uniref:Tigger transposable element-derived protein 2 n=1 Tax=Mycena venus TaxID=2733690 RepID=A0A8H6X3Y3_9AGAR|nr:Tigger transposable element-derived protein 2 [Mycena venus]
MGVPRPRQQFRKDGNASLAKEVIQKAVAAVKDRTYENAAVAARAFGIEDQHKTVWRRLNGKTKYRRAAHMTSQLLNESQEKTLVSWIKFLGIAGIPLSKRTIAPKVTALCGRKPSRRWIYRFMRRHPDCTLGRPAKLDLKRARAFNFSTVQKHFALLQDTLDNGRNPIPASNIYNFDEIGIQIAPANITILETICFDGTANVPPCFVFQGVNMCPEWFVEAYSEDSKWNGDILIPTTESGWTNDKVCATWFLKSFIPSVKAHGDDSAPYVLVYDWHNSHVTVKIIDLALENNIILFCLPPHTTHRLQPCDVGGFGPLKKHWIKACEAILADTGVPMNVKDVVREYLAARRAAFKAETIVQAWAKSGIDQDPTTGGAKDFVPSSSTSAQLQLPDGYPARPASPSSSSESSSSESGSDDESSSSNEEGDDWQDVTSIHPPRHRATLPSSSAVASNAATPSTTPPLPPLPVFTNTFEDSDSELDDDPPSDLLTPVKIAHYRARNQRLKEQRTRARQQRDEAASHAILAGEHIKTLKGQLNAKKSTARGSSGRVVHTQARILTTAEGRAAAAAQKDARDERDAAAVKRQAKKDDAAAASRARRAELTAACMTFTGTFKQQKLGERQDLAWALGLDEKGTKTDLLERIQGHFDLPANVALQKDKRYVALFGKRKRTDETSDDEPVAGPSTTSSQRSPQRRRLDEVGNFVSSPRRLQTPIASRPTTSSQAAVHAPPYYPFPPPPPPQFYPPPQYPPFVPFLPAAHCTLALLHAHLIFVAMNRYVPHAVLSRITTSVALPKSSSPTCALWASSSFRIGVEAAGVPPPYVLASLSSSPYLASPLSVLSFRFLASFHPFLFPASPRAICINESVYPAYPRSLLTSSTAARRPRASPDAHVQSVRRARTAPSPVRPHVCRLFPPRSTATSMTIHRCQNTLYDIVQHLVLLPAPWARFGVV